MNSLRNYLLETGKSTTTTSIIENTVCDFANWCEDQGTASASGVIEAKHATYNEVLSYVKHLQQRRISQRTIQMAVNHLGHYFKWLIDIGVRDNQPTQSITIKGVQRRPLYHIISMQDLEAAYQKLKENEQYLSGDYQLWHKQSHYSTKYYKVMFGFMIWQGLGSGQLMRLSVKDVKLKEGTVYVAGDRRTNERTLKLAPAQIFDLMDYLQDTRVEYQRTNPTPTDQLFITRTPGATTDNHIHAVIRLVKNTNPLLTSAKQIRSSVINHWLKTHNLRQVQYMAGHRYVSSTEAHLANNIEDLTQDIDKFHPME